MLISSPRWACLGVEGKGSATFIYALIREDEQRSEAPLSSAFPPDTDLVYFCLSYRLGLVLKTGFQGILCLPRVSKARPPSINTLAWSWLLVLGWAAGVLLYQLLMTRITHSLRLDA